MTDVFISYKKEDGPRVEPIARALAQAGYEVWWDHRIPPGRTYRDVIGAALQSAKCVIVVWSKLSAGAQWVLDEADEGKKRNVLLPLMIDDVEIPYGFRQIEAARLVGWNGDRADPEWVGVLSSVGHFVGRAPGGPPRPFADVSHIAAPRVAAAQPPQRKSALGPLLGAVAVAALVGGGGYAAWSAGLFDGGGEEVVGEEEVAPNEAGAPPAESGAEGHEPEPELHGTPPEYRTPVIVPGDAMATFFASGFAYCDAKLVADFWGGGIGEAKTLIGDKIINGLIAGVAQALANSRAAGNACEWIDTGYEYADAERLASFWGLANPSEAKFRIAELVTSGHRFVVDQALEEASPM